jgi:hypothetical protein
LAAFHFSRQAPCVSSWHELTVCGTAAIPIAFGELTDSQLDHCYGLKSLLGQSSQERCRTRSHSIAELLRSGPIS